MNSQVKVFETSYLSYWEKTEWPLRYRENNYISLDQVASHKMKLEIPDNPSFYNKWFLEKDFLGNLGLDAKVYTALSSRVGASYYDIFFSFIKGAASSAVTIRNKKYVVCNGIVYQDSLKSNLLTLTIHKKYIRYFLLCQMTSKIPRPEIFKLLVDSKVYTKEYRSFRIRCYHKLILDYFKTQYPVKIEVVEDIFSTLYKEIKVPSEFNTLSKIGAWSESLLPGIMAHHIVQKRLQDKYEIVP